MAFEKKYITPATLLIDDHHRRSGTNVPWTTDEVLKLCALLSITPFELGRLYCVQFKEMDRYLKRNSFPLPLCLHFRMLRNWYVERTIGTIHVPTIPVDYLNIPA